MISIRTFLLFYLVLPGIFLGCTGKKQINDPVATSAMEVVKSDNTPPGEAPEGMVWIPGGTFIAGNDGPEASRHEGPAHQVTVDGFWMDATEVTNAQFREFIEATGYETVAERPVLWEEIKQSLPPGTPRPPDSVMRPGSMVFTPPDHAVHLGDYSQWWSWVIGANWQHPYGPGSDIEGKDDYPVVHIAYEDAVA